VAKYLNDPEFYNGLVARIPMGRVCETADLVGIVVFLASDASAFITGQNIFVDGGVTASQQRPGQHAHHTADTGARLEYRGRRPRMDAGWIRVTAIS